jgi:hypothetical protein
MAPIAGARALFLEESWVDESWFVKTRTKAGVAAFKSSIDLSQVDLRQLAGGIYVVKIQSGKGTEIIRLLKVRE